MTGRTLMAAAVRNERFRAVRMVQSGASGSVARVDVSPKKRRAG